MSADLAETIRDDSGSRPAQVFHVLSAIAQSSPANMSIPCMEDLITTRSDTPLLDATPDLGLPGEKPVQRRYAIETQLGRGSGGEVFSVQDAILQRRIAVKVAHGTADTHASQMSKFAAEARLTANLEHPSILPVYDLGRTPDGRIYFTMREARGRALDVSINEAAQGTSHPSLATWSDRVEVMVRVCEAIAYAHSRNIIHRDIKPANILLGDFGEVLVVDWGSATRTGTVAGQAVGTPQFMAPEQARGEATDERSDIYALGATLWQLLTFRLPMYADDTATFWERKRAGDLDLDAPGDVPEHLLGIARRALAADPAARWKDVFALRDALREWLRNQESLAVSSQAQRELEVCGADARHQDFDRVTENFRRALVLWPGNPSARAGLSLALSRHASFSIKQGDLNLASQLLDVSNPQHAPLLVDLAAAQARRDRIRRRQRWMIPLLVLALITPFVAGGYVWYQSTLAMGRWLVVFDRRFAPGTETTDLRVNWPPLKKPGMLSAPDAQGLVLPVGGRVSVPGIDGRGDVRFTAEVVWRGKVDGLEMLVGVPEMDLPEYWQVPPGYSCQFGGYGGTQTFIGVNLQAGPINPLPSIKFAFEAGRPYRLAFEVVGDTLRLMVDGQEVCRHRQILPVGDRTFRNIAIRAWSELHLRRLTVERLAVAQRAKPTVVGDALVSSGNMADAVSAYMEVADAAPGSPACEEALAKAFLAAIRTGDQQQAPEIRRRLLREFPGTDYRNDLQAASALVDWRAGRWMQALKDTGELLDANPADQTTQLLLKHRPGTVPPEIAQQLLVLIGRGPQISKLDVTGLGITALSPLRGKALSRLDADGNRIHDLTPLQGMPLTVLSLNANPVSDLTPLRGMPLVNLQLQCTPVSDLTPLRGMPLHLLNVRWSPVSDLTPLSECPLQMLAVTGTHIQDLTPLAKATGMRTLYLGWSRIDSLAPLAGMVDLRDLEMQSCPVTDLAPLRGLAIERLVVDDCPLTDLAAVSGMPLTVLETRGVAMNDVRPLANKRLTSLQLDAAICTDGSLIPATALADGGRLSLGSAVTDLSFLAGRDVGVLTLDGIRTSSLEALVGLPIHTLHIRGMSAMSLRPLFRIPTLRLVSVKDSSISGEEIDQLADHLAASGAKEGDINSLRAQAAIADADWRRLRGMAQPVGKGLRLRLGLHMKLQEARALAVRAGARLPCFTDEDDALAVNKYVSEIRSYWMGLSWAADRRELRWDDGRPAARRWVRPEFAPACLYGYVQLSTSGDLGAYPVFVGQEDDKAMEVILEWPRSERTTAATNQESPNQ
jgi:serine/threonine protein kinase/Leucine-rich repeat (LRR) protein